MYLFADLEPQVQGKLLNKLVQPLIARLSVVLEGLADVVVEDGRYFMLLLQLAQVEELLLQLRLLVVVVGQNRAQGSRYKRESRHASEHRYDAVKALNGR